MADNTPIVTVRGPIAAGARIRVGAAVYELGEDVPDDNAHTLYLIEGQLRHWQPQPRPPRRNASHR
jgi:hypothetical protein